MKNKTEESVISFNARDNWYGAAISLVFLYTNLTGYTDWSYWWVFAPVWGPFALVVVFIGFVAALMGFISVFSKNKPKWDFNWGKKE